MPDTTPRPLCEGRVWRHGAEARCGRPDTTTWRDANGTLHAACSVHVAPWAHRYPASGGARDTDPEYRSAMRDAGRGELLR